ncbi:hypothetical protein J6590_090356 [Homalodisca vitripennis]|nr:hypothetical protein J6590_090356 [Homalodisca vitripennis]
MLQRVTVAFYMRAVQLVPYPRCCTMVQAHGSPSNEREEKWLRMTSRETKSAAWRMATSSLQAMRLDEAALFSETTITTHLQARVLPTPMYLSTACVDIAVDHSRAINVYVASVGTVSQ